MFPAPFPEKDDVFERLHGARECRKPHARGWGNSWHLLAFPGGEEYGNLSATSYWAKYPANGGTHGNDITSPRTHFSRSYASSPSRESGGWYSSACYPNIDCFIFNALLQDAENKNCMHTNKFKNCFFKSCAGIKDSVSSEQVCPLRYHAKHECTQGTWIHVMEKCKVRHSDGRTDNFTIRRL